MNLETYQKLAIRTESLVDNIYINEDEFKKVLEMFISCAELLDAYKKKIFYKNSKKYDNEFSQTLDNLIKQSQVTKELHESKNQHQEILKNISPRVVHSMVGIMTEAGEMAEALHKGLESENVDKTNAQEEAIDACWYMAILHDALGLSWDQGLKNNINKLKIRYPEKYSDESAENRNLKAERKALEK